MAQLSLSLLGTFQVTRDNQIISNFRSVNVQGLLVYLALQAQRPFPREFLATLFWPDETDHRAKKNLRQSLYQLRKVLSDSDKQPQPYFTVSRETVQFNAHSHVTLDVAEFLQALAGADLETAVSLYAGDLLPGFTCNSLEFENWLRGERERLHGLALKTMADLAERQLRNGRVTDAQATARRQLDLEPWSESGYRHLIEALALAGDRSSALAQFERCREILEEEMGLSPEPETISLVERIQNNELRPVDANLIAGRYALGPEIGRGSMGAVFQGRDSQTGTAVAIKKLGAAAITAKPDLLPRFQQEGEALRRLNHPNIVQLLAMDERDGRHYLVMEYIPGGDLCQWLQKEGALQLKQVLNIALDLADALTRAHRLEILHRDIKPGNVLLDNDGLPRLADFGLARLGQESLLTAHDNIVGTVAYLSPEACLGEVLDARADIWSFGVLLYEMLLGERPFAAPTPAGIINQILNTPLPDVMALRPDMPEALADLLYRMLAKSKADRIPSVRLVGAELEAILQAAERELASNQGSPRSDPLPSGRPAFATPTPERMMRMRHNLPAQAIPFVGREAELAELERLLADPSVRLMTILGPGGMGKTRLSLEVAGRMADTTVAFPDGIFLVELATLTSAEQMITAVATALGFAIEKEIEPRQQILDFLSNKQLLLLLDNFEQLLASPENGAEVVTAVLQTAPAVKIIVTSRQKLNLSSEVLFVLEGLAFPDWQTTADALNYSAVQLFLQSARRARVDFELTAANLPPVARICRLTEGMPLGIVLAAAWVDMLSIAEIADEMQADIDFLESEMRDLPPRQRSMRAVFDYSWALLTEKEKDVLAKLSVFQGGFTRQAAQAVTGSTLRQLLALVNKSLVQRDVGSGRYSIHELLRQLAESKLRQLPENHDAIQAYSNYFAQLIRGLWHDLLFLVSPQSMAILNADRDNFRHVWIVSTQNGFTKNLTLMARPLLYFYSSIGLEKEAQSLFAQTVRAYSQQGMPETSPDMLTLRLSEAMSWISSNPSLCRQLNLNIAEKVEKTSLYPIRQIVYSQLAFINFWMGNSEESRSWCEKLYQLSQEMQDKVGVNIAELLLLQFDLLDDLNENRLKKAQEVLMFLKLHSPQSIYLIVLNALVSKAWLKLEQYQSAIAHAQDALSIAQEWQYLEHLGNAFSTMAGIYHRVGQLKLVYRYLAENIEWHLMIGQDWQLLGCLQGIVLQFPALLGDLHQEVSILSLTYYHPQTMLKLKSNIESIRQRYKAEIGEELFEDAWARGQEMDVGETAVFLLKELKEMAG